MTTGFSPASAQQGFDFERLAGNDRFETAADIAIKTFGTADTVLLATGVKFPDALTGNYLAGAIGDTPLLLTLPDAVPGVTRAALETLGAKNVIILGGTVAVSPAVEDDLNDDFAVERVGGTNRYETAEDVANRAASGTVGMVDTGTVGMGDTGTVGMFEGLRTAVLGSGEAYPDVLAAGPLGYAAGFPITITFPNSLRPETRRVLEDLDIQKVIIVGGTDAISAGVETEVETLTGNDARRVSGPTRFDTATAIANFAYDDLDFDASHVNLARGDDAPAPSGLPQGFADALTGGPHGGNDRSPIVLTNPNTLPAVTRTLLEERCPSLLAGHIFGGDRAVSQAVKDEATTAASNCDAGTPATGTSTMTVTPQ